MDIFLRFNEKMLKAYKDLFDRSSNDYKISHFKSIEIKSGHWIIDNVFKCFIYKGFDEKVFSPMYFRPVISRSCKYNMF